MPEVDRDQRVRAFLKATDRLGVELSIVGGRVRARSADPLTEEMSAELLDLKPELLEYLTARGEEIIYDPEELGHSDMSTLPRSAEEVDKQRADAERARERARRRYQGGAVLVNDRNSFGFFMRRLRELREAGEARERGELPPAGQYATRFDIFR